MPCVDPSAIAAAALDYCSRGWKVVPLYGLRETTNEAGEAGPLVCECGRPSCSQRSNGKHPRFAAWQDHASRDEDTVATWCEQWPEMNIGVKLGPDSGIIDVEFDGDEGRQAADRLLAECFTPTFASGRSVHRLFKWTPLLPDKQKVLVAGLEVRIGGGGKGTQTVFPPSRHWAGQSYRWLPGLDPGAVDVQEVPQALLLMMTNDPGGLLPGIDGPAADSKPAKPKEHWDRVIAGVAEGASSGGRNESAASVAGKILRNLLRIDSEEALGISWEMLKAWNARNRPPLDEGELKTTFSSILRAERSRRADEEIQTALPYTHEEHVGQATNEGTYQVGSKADLKQIRLVIIQSDPPLAQIHCGRFSAAKDGCVQVQLSDLASYSSVRRAALAQARYLMPVMKDLTWDKHLRPLVENAEIIAAPPEATTDGMLAARILHAIRNTVADGEKNRKISFSDLRARVTAGDPNVVSDRDLALLLKRVDATRVRENDLRFWVFSQSAIGKLREFAG